MCVWQGGGAGADLLNARDPKVKQNQEGLGDYYFKRYGDIEHWHHIWKYKKYEENIIYEYGEEKNR